MIQIEELSHIPQLLWTEHCSAEFETSFVDDIEKQTTVMWLISADVPLVVAGLIYKTLVNPPWLWFLLTKEFEEQALRNVKWLHQLTKHLPSGTLTAVDADFERGARFAEFFGFIPTRHQVKQMAKLYDIYGRY